MSEFARRVHAATLAREQAVRDATPPPRLRGQVGEFHVPYEAETEQMDAILDTILPRVLTNFARKHAEYGEARDDDLGYRGHFADIHRKVKKLRRYLWDGEHVRPGAESVEQIAEELIGHLLLLLEHLDREAKE